jgi:hypothetical protein
MWSTSIRSPSRRVWPSLISQDGDYWLFFYENYGVYGRVRCFFVPALFSASANGLEWPTNRN